MGHRVQAVPPTDTCSVCVGESLRDEVFPVTENALAALRKELGAAPPRTLAELAPEQIHDLAEAVAAARRRQATELAAAGDAAFGHVPRLLRGPIRKVLG